MAPHAVREQSTARETRESPPPGEERKVFVGRGGTVSRAMPKRHREFWLVSSSNLTNIDVREQHFTAEVYMKFFFFNSSFMERSQVTHNGVTKKPGEFTKDVVFHANGKPNRGFQIVDMGEDSFPVDPQRPCLNALSGSEVAMDWVAYDQTTGLVSAQLHGTFILRCLLNTGAFPFDRHMLPMILGCRRGRTPTGEKYAWVLPDRSRPETLDGNPLPPPEYPEDAASFSENKKLTDPMSPWVSVAPYVDLANEDPDINTETGKPQDHKLALSLRVVRNPFHFMTNGAFQKG